MEGAAWGVVTPPPAVLPLLSLGGLAVILWQGRARWAGLVPLTAALVLWGGAPRPALLVAPSGGVLAVLGPEGRAVSRATGDAFVVEGWLENDGDIEGQEAAALRPGIERGERQARAEVAGVGALLVRGKRALAAVEGCGGAPLLVTDQEDAGPRPCLVLDARTLRGSGAVAGWPDGDGLRLVAAEAVAGDRPWTRAGRDGAPPELPPLAPWR
jgi:competence protein ComEC